MRTVRVELGERSYPIHVAAGATGELRAWRARDAGRRQIVIVADQTVAELHLAKLTAALAGATVVTFPPGETSKSLQRAEAVFDQLATARVERTAAIVAFGGGVAGDLGGFIAGTWLRGVSFIQVPTSFLAAVDASVGGKTGVNLNAGKNLVGVFHQPELVVIDTDYLATLPDRELRAGLAESVKHAAIRAPELLQFHLTQADPIARRDPGTLTELIARNCEIKAAVVAADEREAGLRAILNYGHTIGHALEHVLEYELRHGECVALGMLVENEIAQKRGMLSASEAALIARVLEGTRLPRRLPRPVDTPAILAACRVDKKVADGRVNFVLLAGLGSPQRVHDVADDEIAAALSVITPP